MSYNEPQQIVKAQNSLFIRASNDLYQYNLNDHSITTYDKITGPSDTYITSIAWSQEAKRLIIAYQNANIDLLTPDGDVFNISSIYTKSITQDKTIHSIYVNGTHAYLSTGFGVVNVDMQRGEISETYMLSRSISHVAISGTNIYALSADGSVLSASTTANLINPANWNLTADYPSGIFNSDTSD